MIVNAPYSTCPVPDCGTISQVVEPVYNYGPSGELVAVDESGSPVLRWDRNLEAEQAELDQHAAEVHS